jgi:lipid A disaccharide synthetase
MRIVPVARQFRDLASYRPLHVYLLAGEASGDLIGSQLMGALKRKYGDEVQFRGIGGSRMESEGLVSLFSMSELSIMGFLEVLPSVPRLYWRLRQTVQDVQEHNPDVVVTIDSKGFNFRVLKALRTRQTWLGWLLGKPRVRIEYPLPCVHYVAPSIWAYRNRHSKATHAMLDGELFDHLLLIVPWETRFFEAMGATVPCTYVGHPCIENFLCFNSHQWGNQNQYKDNQYSLSIFPKQDDNQQRISTQTTPEWGSAEPSKTAVFTQYQERSRRPSQYASSRAPYLTSDSDLDSNLQSMFRRKHGIAAPTADAATSCVATYNAAPATTEAATSRLACPACGFKSSDNEGFYGSYCVCKVCHWEDDPLQLQNPATGGGANTESLIEWQIAVLDKYPLCTTNVGGIIRDERWRPLSVREIAQARAEYNLHPFKSEGKIACDRVYWRVAAAQTVQTTVVLALCPGSREMEVRTSMQLFAQAISLFVEGRRKSEGRASGGHIESGEKESREIESGEIESGEERPRSKPWGESQATRESPMVQLHVVIPTPPSGCRVDSVRALIDEVVQSSAWPSSVPVTVVAVGGNGKGNGSSSKGNTEITSGDGSSSREPPQHGVAQGDDDRLCTQWAVFAAADAAICISGSVSMELACASPPAGFVVCYPRGLLHPVTGALLPLPLSLIPSFLIPYYDYMITEWFAKRWILHPSIRHVTLLNLFKEPPLLEEEVNGSTGRLRDPPLLEEEVEVSTSQVERGSPQLTSPTSPAQAVTSPTTVPVPTPTTVPVPIPELLFDECTPHAVAAHIEAMVEARLAQIEGKDTPPPQQQPSSPSDAAEVQQLLPHFARWLPVATEKHDIANGKPVVARASDMAAGVVSRAALGRRHRHTAE